MARSRILCYYFSDFTSFPEYLRLLERKAGERLFKILLSPALSSHNIVVLLSHCGGGWDQGWGWEQSKTEEKHDLIFQIYYSIQKY